MKSLNALVREGLEEGLRQRIALMTQNALTQLMESNPDYGLARTVHHPCLAETLRGLQLQMGQAISRLSPKP